MLTPEEIADLTLILHSLGLPPSLQQVDLVDLVMRGAVVTLEQDGSDEAILLLSKTVSNSPIPAIRELALGAIERLSLQGCHDAVEAMYSLAIDSDHSGAVEFLLRNEIPAKAVREQVLFAFLFAPREVYLALDPDYRKLTGEFLTEPQSSTRERLIKAAERHGMDNWIWIAVSLAGPDSADVSLIVDRFGDFAPLERSLAIEGLHTLAESGHQPAQSALAEIYIQYEDARAGHIAVQHHYNPDDPARQALFYFLTEQWEAYERIDFSHNLLNSAYETGGTALRQRILAHSRYTGQIEWLNVGQSRRLRWLADLTDADWQSTIRQLRESGRMDVLWRLAQSAPPVWSAYILSSVDAAPSTPEASDNEDFLRLHELANQAHQMTIEIKPKKSLQTIGAVTSLAASPDGRYLAAGGPDPLIQLWKFPRGQSLSPFSGPVAQTRALCFSPEGDTLACASADNAIRVFRLSDGQLIKTLIGHTGLVRSLIIHPDGRVAFSASFDGTLRAWRYPNGPELRKFEPNGGELFGLAFSENGRTVLAAGVDQRVHVWKWPEGQEIHHLSGAKDIITTLTASPQGQLVAASSRDHSILIWNHTTSRLVQHILLADVPVTTLLMHPDQKLLFGGGYDGSINIWNISTGESLARFGGERSPITGLAFQPEEDILISGAGNKILLWDLEVLLLVHSPFETAQPEAIARLQDKLEENNLPASTRVWVEYVLAMLKWKARFDIEIGAPEVIPLGEFDIQL